MNGAGFPHVLLTCAGVSFIVTSVTAKENPSIPDLEALTFRQMDSAQMVEIENTKKCKNESESSKGSFWNETLRPQSSKGKLEFLNVRLKDFHIKGEISESSATQLLGPTCGSYRGGPAPTRKEVLVISLVKELFREFDDCALVIVHDAVNELLATTLVKEDKLERQPKAVFNLGSMSLQELLQMSSGFISLRTKSCIHYLMLAAEDATVRRVLHDLAIRDALNMKGKFVIIAGAMDEEDKLVFFESAPVDHIRDVLLVTPTASGSALQLSTHHFFSASARVEVQELGVWGPWHAAAAARFKVSTFNYPPVVIWDPNVPCEDQDPRSNTECAEGLEVRILKAIAETLNFSAWLQMPKDGELWGAMLDNGSWTGSSGEVIRGEVEVSFANYFITGERPKVMDMTTLYSIDYACFITPIPPPPPQYTVVVRPFHYVVWLCLGLSLLLLVPFLALTARRTPADLSFRDVGKSSMFLWAILMSQSLHDQILPSTAPVRLCFIFFSLASFIVSVAYRSSLFSYILVPAASVPVDTLQQLLTSGLKWGVRDSGGWTVWFSDSKDPTARQIYEGFQYVKSIESGIKRVQNGDFAFMNSGRFLRYLVARNFTDVYGQAKLHVSKECFVPFTYVPPTYPCVPQADASVSFTLKVAFQ